MTKAEILKRLEGVPEDEHQDALSDMVNEKLDQMGSDINNCSESAQMDFLMSGGETSMWLVVVVGDGEPEIHGPYKDGDERDAAALEHRKGDEGDEDGIFKLDCEGTPEVETYSGGFFDDDDDEEDGV
jgi:hypothetical protein